MKADKFPFPKIEEVIDNMAGPKNLTNLNIFAGYRQIKLAGCIREKIALRCKFGYFQFKAMPFGLMNDPYIFQSMAESLFKIFEFVLVYIDDVIIGSVSIEEHTNHLIFICDQIGRSGPKVNLKKYVLATLRF